MGIDFDPFLYKFIIIGIEKRKFLSKYTGGGGKQNRRRGRQDTR